MKTKILLVLVFGLALAWYLPVAPVYADEIIVNKADDTDDGECAIDCSLREAVDTANIDDTITFDNDYTIVLGSSLIISDTALTIDGSGHDIVISGDNITRAFDIQSDAELDLYYLTLINGNAGDSGDGGAILNDGYVIMRYCTLRYNQAGDDGGAIANRKEANIQKTQIYSNTAADDGGAIFNYSSASDDYTTLRVSNSTISHNDGDGAVTQSYFGSNETTIYNSTIVSNTSSMLAYSRGLRNTSGDDPMTVYNSIVAYHDTNCTLVTSDGYNLEDQNDCGFSATGDQINTDPLLAALGDYGGETLSYAPLPGSPAIDAIPDAATDCNGSDQRGISRPQNGACDVGAFESRGFTLSASGGDNQGAQVGYDFTYPLEVTIVANNASEPVGGGGEVTFSGPSSGAGLVSDVSATINSSAQASASVTANSIAGSYTVTATTAGATTDAVFSLTNCSGSLQVTNDQDSGAGSLRQAISDACNGQTLTFADDYTITLSSVLNITRSVTIDGSDQTVILDGNDAVQILNISASGVVTLNQLTLQHGHNFDGSGIYNAGTLTVNDSTFFDNDYVESASSQGGGIYNAGSVTVNTSLFSGNSQGEGGGVYNASGATATINRSTFASNSSEDGDGIYNAGTATINNTTLSEYYNAIYGQSGTLTINNSTLYNSGVGAQVLRNTSGSTLHLTNSLIKAPNPGTACDNSGTIATNVNNFISDGTCNQGTVLSGYQSGDPLLADLGDYGGPTVGSGQVLQTHALLPGSPAIDAGDSDTCSGDDVASIDQRGVSRPVGACDVGAFESQGFTLALESGSGQSASVNTAFAAPLVARVTANDSAEPVGPDGLVAYDGPSSGASISPISTTVAATTGGWRT